MENFKKKNNKEYQLPVSGCQKLIFAIILSFVFPALFLTDIKYF